MTEWKEYPLKALGSVATGKTPSKNNSEDWGDEMPFVFGFLSSLSVALISAGVVYLSQRLIDRPVVRIEHIDFKSERVPFKLESELWWRLTHGGIVEFVDKRVSWPVTCFEKNEFFYHQLQDLGDIIDQRINTYQGTADWTQALIERIHRYGESESEVLRNEILADMSPDIVKFEDHYRETKKASLFKDIVEKPKEAATFMESEAHGLLVAHKRELNSYQTFKGWIMDCLLRW